MSEEENNQSEDSQENEELIPDIDTNTYEERELNTDDLEEK